MVDVFDFDISEEDRVTYLQQNSHELYSVMEQLLAEFRISNLHSILDFIQHIVKRMSVPVESVLDIVAAAQNSRPQLAKQVLVLNLDRCLETRVFIPSILSAYLKYGCSFSGLKAHLLHQLSGMVRTRIIDAPRLITAVSYTSVDTLVNKRAIESLLRGMSKFMLDMYLTIGIDETNGKYFVLCISHVRLSKPILKTLIGQLKILHYDGKADLVDALHTRIEGMKDRLKFVDEYIELDEVLQSLRFDSNKKRSFSDDKQNVHRLTPAPAVLMALALYEETIKDREDSLDELYSIPSITDTLYRIDNDHTLCVNRTLKDLLRVVYIWAKDGDHMAILIQELEDMSGTCSTGHFIRLLNVMNGITFFMDVDTGRDPTRDALFTRATELIKSQPDYEDIIADMEALGAKYANQIAKEMLAESYPWGGVMRARRAYIHGA